MLILLWPLLIRPQVGVEYMLKAGREEESPAQKDPCSSQCWADTSRPR